MSFNDSKGSVMMEFNTVAAKTPTLADVKQQFALADHEIDDTFGIIPLDRPEGRSFLAVVSTEAADRLEKQKPSGFVQNWSNARMSST